MKAPRKVLSKNPSTPSKHNRELTNSRIMRHKKRRKPGAPIALMVDEECSPTVCLGRKFTEGCKDHSEAVHAVAPAILQASG